MAVSYRYVIGPVVEHTFGGLTYYGPPESCVSWIDLRRMSEQSALGQLGCGFFTMPSDWVKPSEYTMLGNETGDLRSLYFSEADQSAWASLIGTTIPRNASTMLVDALALQLTDYSDPTGDEGPKPLVAGTPPPGPPPIADIILAGHSTVWSREYHFDKPGLRWTQRVRDLWRADLTRIAAFDDVLWRKALGAEKQKHGQRWDDPNEVHLMPPGLAKERGPANPGLPVSKRRFAMRPETSYSDSFNRADASTLGGSWTNFLSGSGEIGIASNNAYFGKAATWGGGVAESSRYDSDVSSSDHEVEMTCVSYAGIGGSDFWYGPCGRFSSSDETCYFYGPFANTVSGRALVKIVSSTGTTLATTGLATNANGDVYKQPCNGSAISGTRNGSADLSVTDTAISSGTRGGVSYRSVYFGAQATGNDWSIADLAAATSYPHGLLPLLGVG